jgi:hypothetical protein
MKTIFFYYYLFYTKVIIDDEPYATTVFVLSVSEGFLINFLIQFLSANFYCESLSLWTMILVQLLIILINYLYFNKSGRAKKIVKLKPMFFSNHMLSIILTVLFFVVTSSFIFWGPIYLKTFLGVNCK